MPTYDMRCLECGCECDVTCSYSIRHEYVCPECDGELESRITSPPAIVGAVWDKKIRVGGSDKVFSTNGELRAYESELERDGWHIVSTGSSDWRNHVDKANNVGNNCVKRAGFNDSEHFSKETKKALHRGGSALR